MRGCELVTLSFILYISTDMVNMFLVNLLLRVEGLCSYHCSPVRDEHLCKYKIFEQFWDVRACSDMVALSTQTLYVPILCN